MCGKRLLNKYRSWKTKESIVFVANETNGTYSKLENERGNMYKQTKQSANKEREQERTTKDRKREQQQQQTNNEHIMHT